MASGGAAFPGVVLLYGFNQEADLPPGLPNFLF